MRINNEFTGPIFIVGMPRSGTKLLREILNNHSFIAIMPNESHCIPYFYDRLNKYGNLQDIGNFDRFYNDFSKTIFYKRATKRDEFIDRVSWYNAVREWSYAGIIEAFYKTYTLKKNKIIWGDKTPSYLLHLPLLASLFPQAKFIHIIRDVRDYCLSINKAWNKNIYRAAQRWSDSIRKCRSDSRKLTAGQYIEMGYEKLIMSPYDAMREICSFLNIPYENQLLTFNKSTENLGDARDFLGILETNHGKWEEGLRKNSVVKIEKICSRLLSELGYPVSFPGEERRLGHAELFLYKMLDGFNLFRFGMKRQHVMGVVRNVMKANIHRTVNKV